MHKDETARAIQAALEHAPDVNTRLFPIRVLNEGDEVRLEGEVENIIAKRRALQIARAAAPQAHISDGLRLRIAQRQEDQELTQTVVRTLAGEPVFANFRIDAELAECDRADWIGVSARSGVVRLLGSANSLSHRRMAEVLTWWVRGCADVDNRIRVEPAEHDNDAEISDAVRLILDKDPSIDAQQIGVRTRNKEVFLTGAVPSEDARRIVSYDCWYIPGVHAVHNDISVRAARSS
jgi:osmotically-inducible protein OsmY